MANVFGFSTEPAGDFLPILKYDFTCRPPVPGRS